MLWDLFITFFKIGLFTFGGGYAMIAQMREVVVEHKGWLDEEQLMEVIAIAESTPGPIAINLATYVGYRRKGLAGSLAATLGVVLPSVAIIYIISLFLDRFMGSRYIAYAFTGIKCAVAFLILRAGTDMFRKLERKPLPMIVFGVVLAVILVLELLSVSFSSVLFITAGGVLGVIACALSGLRKGTEK